MYKIMHIADSPKLPFQASGLPDALFQISHSPPVEVTALPLHIKAALVVLPEGSFCLGLPTFFHLAKRPPAPTPRWAQFLALIGG